jgi:hypothetical protein
MDIPSAPRITDFLPTLADCRVESAIRHSNCAFSAVGDAQPDD